MRIKVLFFSFSVLLLLILLLEERFTTKSITTRRRRSTVDADERFTTFFLRAMVVSFSKY